MFFFGFFSRHPSHEQAVLVVEGDDGDDGGFVSIPELAVLDDDAQRLSSLADPVGVQEFAAVDSGGGTVFFREILHL